MLIFILIFKSDDWVVGYWFAFSAIAGWWEPLACNAGLSPMSCCLNIQ